MICIGAARRAPPLIRINLQCGVAIHTQPPSQANQPYGLAKTKPRPANRGDENPRTTALNRRQAGLPETEPDRPHIDRPVWFGCNNRTRRTTRREAQPDSPSEARSGPPQPAWRYTRPVCPAPHQDRQRPGGRVRYSASVRRRGHQVAWPYARQVGPPEPPGHAKYPAGPGLRSNTAKPPDHTEWPRYIRAGRQKQGG